MNLLIFDFSSFKNPPGPAKRQAEPSLKDLRDRIDDEIPNWMESHKSHDPQSTNQWSLTIINHH